MSLSSPAPRAPRDDGILILDGGGRVAYCTEAAAATAGREPDEIIGAPASLILSRVPSPGEAATVDLLHADGTRLPVSIHVDSWEAAGQPFLIVIIQRDRALRERIEMTREADEAKHMTSLRRVAATMAHEFNNVLAGIGSFAEYLNRRAADDETRRAAAHIGKAVRRGKTVTDEILRYTRSRPLQLAMVDVRAWLEAFLPEANALTGGRTVLESGEGLFIRGDAGQLNQALVNLVINARDASPPDAPVLLRAGRNVRDGVPVLDLAVIDYGTGIAPDIRDRIFEPLFTTKRAATGLGLPVVDRVVRAHEGVVRMRTELGKGTEFHVLIPLAGG